MKKRKRIAWSHNMKKGILDDDYTLYDDGEVVHSYDKSQYPGGQDFSDTVPTDKLSKLSEKVKDDFIESASPEYLEWVKKLIGR